MDLIVKLLRVCLKHGGAFIITIGLCNAQRVIQISEACRAYDETSTKATATSSAMFTTKAQ